MSTTRASRAPEARDSYREIEVELTRWSNENMDLSTGARKKDHEKAPEFPAANHAVGYILFFNVLTGLDVRNETIFLFILWV